jgi:hypothetical protein
VFLRKLCPTALGVWIGVAGGASQGQERPSDPQFPIVTGQEPGHLSLAPSVAKDASAQFPNQRMADAIAERLHSSGSLRGYRVDIRFAEGVAELSGRVADAAQRAEVRRIVSSMAGVQRIHDALEVEIGGVVLTAQGANEVQAPFPGLLAPQQAPAGLIGAGPIASDQAMQAAPFAGGAPQEPISIMPTMGGFNPGMPNPAMQQPPLPPYAWPTYAPYNNYSRVGYPTLYPYEAFPFIGPQYPFPKVPLGWRAVTLSWQDGHWFYGKTATGHDWWRIRYY